jgi:cation diffusion facilitator CzcD-associated flavoprotein CzcO
MACDFDILIIGAGVSGIGVACRLSDRFPGKSLAILERRETIGGTWDLFRYPGIRSDSDMFTYSYEFRPWDRADIFAGAETIKDYVVDTADAYGLQDKIRFGRKVLSAEWSSADSMWTIAALDETSGETERYTCRFLVACTGYYDYARGFTPDFPGIGDYGGRLVHPQHWPEDLDYSGKRVVVIGSGATAATLVPAMAQTAAHVTIVQRSPSYYYSVPAREILFRPLRWLLPDATALRLLRKRNLHMQYWIYNACRRWPRLLRRFLLWRVRVAIGPKVDMRHFTPRYGPWDERLCILPDHDLFESLRCGDASIVTSEIATFTRGGLRLESGQELEADIVVSATGFNLRAFGDIAVTVDGTPCEPNERMIYKGVLVEGVPNLAAIFGYINFTWTTKVDLASAWLCRLFELLDERGATVAVARDDGAHAIDDSIMNQLQSGYVRRGGDSLPRQGSEAPWQVTHDYFSDRKLLLDEPVDDGVLQIGAWSA